jgi:hypothetical protein
VKPNSEVWEVWHDVGQGPFRVSASVLSEILGCGYKGKSGTIMQYNLYTKSKSYSTQDGAKIAMRWDHDHEEEAIDTFYHDYPQFCDISPGMLFHKDFSSFPICATLDQIV